MLFRFRLFAIMQISILTSGNLANTLKANEQFVPEDTIGQMTMQHSTIKNITIWRVLCYLRCPGKFMRNKMPFWPQRENNFWEFLPRGVANATVASLLDGAKFI